MSDEVDSEEQIQSALNCHANTGPGWEDGNEETLPASDMEDAG